jgi:hypothetical protein
MPRVSKATKTPPTIRQRAKEPEGGLIEPSEAAGLIGEGEALMTGAPDPGVTTSTGTLPTVVLTEDRIVKIHAPTPLVSFHLRRVEDELTDVARTVHIPSPAMVKDGERVVIHVYREE